MKFVERQGWISQTGSIKLHFVKFLYVGNMSYSNIHTSVFDSNNIASNLIGVSNLVPFMLETRYGD